MREALCRCPEWLSDIWAKSPAPGETEGQSLCAHTWEVLARLRDLASLRPWLPELCGFPRLWNVLFWAAFFHDWGKAARGFQDMLKRKGKWPHRHEVLSLLFLEWILAAGEADEVAAVILSHHRDADELERLYPPGLSPEDDPLSEILNELEEATLQKLYRWLAEICPVWVKELGFDKLGVSYSLPISFNEAVAGKQSGPDTVRRLLSRYSRLVRGFREGTDPSRALAGILLRGLMLQADHAASAFTGVIAGLAGFRQKVLTGARLSLEKLYFHQKKAAEAPECAVLVAPTGSGKTEAALLWAARQAETRHGLPRLFYVLPYQASMNAMYDRLTEIFTGQVGLLHSRSLLALYRRFMEREENPAEAAGKARRERNLARLRFYPVSIFSPYQMLKGVYRLKGYEAILADYAGAAFIFDEIHAYEPGRLAMILETIGYLRKNFGSRFFIMSATLPRPVRLRVQEVLGDAQSIIASPDLFHAFSRHQINLLEGELLEKGSLEQIVSVYRKGGAVLVTCNTVKRAQEAYRCLKGKIPEERLVLLHGRFNGRDRLEKEGRIMEAVAVGKKQRNPAVVVATQVVEVSLNIDLDVLFTDPAPLEALVQRFGRVNRKRRVALAPVNVFVAPARGEGVYSSELVEKSLNILEKNANGRAVDESLVQTWLDEIYTGEVLNRWENGYEQVAGEFRRAFLDTLRPFDSDDALEEAFARLFDGVEVLPAVLWEEYRALREQRPLEASQLLVPISWGWWEKIRKAGLVRSRPGEWPPVVDVPYSPEMGLEPGKA
ncbi:CRISPR-associated helicase Cas3' [Desulfofundulus thermobenzoicus]|uniref:CRISPR-associated helicase Cas3 n=1 Tax=Desulfofundulus thermobenzoicus TaxID=29376 RepID=A0A6N7IMY9_9FIRM|nr:CRISPR-associated helicase Cas3' [Desulfofundulus thermobenzoicus]MQL50698.1 CRISPR-associated helicase Cas3' [Desulfofundulus thermobenzoicus]